jgi:hypothetical protein
LGHFYISTSAPEIQIFAPLLEHAQFDLGDSRYINFTQSTFGSHLKCLIFKTPSRILSALETPALYPVCNAAWTHYNFLVDCPLLEEVVMGVHMLNATSQDNCHIHWPMVKKMT